MRGSAEWKPKLRWLMSRMRLLRPSRRPLLRPRRIRESFSAPDVRLAVALFGADTVGHEHAGVRDAYELLKAESERIVG